MLKKRTLLFLPLYLLAVSTLIQKKSVKVTAASLSPVIDFSIRNDGQVSTYYQGVDGKTGDELVGFLYNKIKNHIEFGFESTDMNRIFKITDRNWALDSNDMIYKANLANFDYVGDNGYMHKLYADYNDDIVTADRYKNEGATRVSFDKEHIWAQSLGDFGRNLGAGSDLHALWASDVVANQNAHNNYNFAFPTTNIRDYMSDKDSYIGRNGNIEGFATKVFEPLDQYKGDIARAMFYMPARYYEYIDKEHPKLELVNGSPAARVASPTLTGQAGDLATLLLWNELDPVDEHEIRRNNLIANNYQGNRNPFIDYPQWARIAYDPNYSGHPASNAPETSSVGSNSDQSQNATLTHITLNTTYALTSFFIGDGYDTHGLIVTAHYDNGYSRPVMNYTTSKSNGTFLATAGTETITVSVSHKGVQKTATYDILITNASITDYLFISEVYGGGGNSGSTYTHDFIELYNYANFPISLAGKSIQYATSTGTTWTKTNLVGTLSPKSFYLIQQAKGTGGTTALPLPELIGSTPLAATAFKLALVNGTDSLDGSDPSSLPLVIDFVGAGNANASIESPAVAPSNTESIARKFIKKRMHPPATKNNSLDYEKNTPTPANAALSIAEDIMLNNTINQCIDLYEPFKARVLNLSLPILNDQDEVILLGQLTYFQTGLEVRMVNGRERYLAWATYHGDNTPFTYQDLNSAPSNRIAYDFDNASLIFIALFIVSTLLFVPLKKSSR